ncbi:MAG: B12-binding domain-containing radical SAM protein [Nitrospira sp.]|nr:B12-binding domain-containing radical SAM protein [Nitrospira sp.]
MNARPQQQNGKAGCEGRPLRVVLVDNFFLSIDEHVVSAPLSLHMGLASLAGVLRQAGHEPVVIDPKETLTRSRLPSGETVLIDAVAAEICLAYPDVVGFTAYGLSFPYAIAFAKAVKSRRPFLPIVLGGPHGTQLASLILERFECFDVVARYEAEEVIVPLVEGLAKSKDVTSLPGIASRLDGSVSVNPQRPVVSDLNSLPPSALDLMPGISRCKVLPIEAGRGCPYECSFCSTATFFQRRYRAKSNDRLLAEMLQARAEYGIDVFDLNHDLFGLNRNQLLEFCRLVEPERLSWTCSMRPDMVDEALATRLTAAGCTHVYFGVETGSPRLQLELKKRLKLQKLKHHLAEFAKLGPAFTVSFITGFPDENADDQDATLDLLGELLKISPERVLPQLHLLSPEPGTELWNAQTTLHFDSIGPDCHPVPFRSLIENDSQLFGVFHYFDTRCGRQRCLAASTFVNRLMPLLSYSLIAYLCHQHYEGQLSHMFRGAFDRIDSEGDFHSAGMDQLLDSLLHSVRKHTPWIDDFVRLRRAVALSRRLPILKSENAIRMVKELDMVHKERVLYGHFDFDVALIARKLARYGAKTVVQSMPVRERVPISVVTAPGKIDVKRLGTIVARL